MYFFRFFFLFCFMYKTIFAVTIDSKYHSLNWKDVSVTNVDIFEQPRPQGAFPWLWRERGKSALGTGEVDLWEKSVQSPVFP